MVVSLRTFAFVFALGALAAGTAAAQTGTITGRVTDADGGRPVVGATVRALVATGTAAAATMTNDEGQYRLSVSPGTYTISVRRIGYGEAERRAVVVPAGGTTEADVTTSAVAIELNPTIVTATRTEEKALDAPAHTEVVTPTVIEERPTLTPVEQIRSVPGVDYAGTGIQGGNVVVRGFNNVFSGAMLTISDYRYATVPSLRVNTPYLMPTPNEDVGQIEVVLGPGAALYGPNAANGVMHILSRSPFESKGTTVSIGGGNRDILRGAFRHAGAVSERFGYKISAQVLRGDDWRFADRVEDSLRAQAIAGGADPDTLRIGRRDFDVERWGGEVRFDFRPTTSSEVILSGGRAFAGTALEMTGIGTAQAKDWGYDYVQGRWRWNRLFVQAFLNTSDTKDTYLLRTGQGVVDKSRVIVGQVQHGLDVGERLTFIYGVDYQKTDPRTLGTINGRNEDIDEISELGGYVQSEARLSDMFDFVVAGRVDDHSELEDPVFSPRAALVFKPDTGHTVRLTYNRAFNTPTTNNLFLDLVASRIASGPFTFHEVRTLGVPESGFRFQRDCATGVGSLCMRQSPLLAQLTPGGADPSALLAAEATRTWRGVIELLIAQGAPTTLRGIPQPNATQVASVLAQLNLTTLQFAPVAPTQIRDVDRLRPTITNTYEVGYNGLIGNSVRLAADVYYEKKNDFVGPLIVESPNIFYERTSLQAYLTPFVGAATAAALATQVSRIPVGTVTPTNSSLTTDSDLVLTYRNFGDLDRWGADVAFDGLLTDRVSINGSYSWVNKNFFGISEVGGISDVALNGPRNKATLGATYRERPVGITVDLRGRWVESFPMNSGAFIGRVGTYVLADASVAYRFPFAQNTILSLNVQNVFDDRHQEFIGAPELGRLILTQLQVTF
jgi:outer membrane receptor for ferrienterochelin and colicins